MADYSRDPQCGGNAVERGAFSDLTRLRFAIDNLAFGRTVVVFVLAWRSAVGAGDSQRVNCAGCAGDRRGLQVSQSLRSQA